MESDGVTVSHTLTATVAPQSEKQKQAASHQVSSAQKIAENARRENVKTRDQVRCEKRSEAKNDKVVKRKCANHESEMMKRNYDVQHVAAAGMASKHGKSSSTLFDKLTKRYSGVIGTRFLRKAPGRKGGVAEPLSDSYDMCGSRSDDFRPEIGAPVLISKTMKFDFDTDSSVEQLPLPSVPTIDRRVRSVATPSTSEGSENDVFLDANSSLPNFGEIKFTFLPESNNNCRSFQDENVRQKGSGDLEKSRSKSAHNLHRHSGAEMRLSLAKAPSLNISANTTDGATVPAGGGALSVPNSPAVESIYDFPRSTRSDGIRKPHGESSYDLTRSHHVLNEINLSLVSDDSHLYQNLPGPADTRYDVPRRGSSSTNDSTQEEEFDLKSASCQSLADAGPGANQLAVSMDELDELTRQINQSTVGLGTTPLPDSDEYCEHRQQLHPSERRLTLMKNRGATGKHLLDFDRRKAKITKKWSGFKSWIGEEQGRIREVVQKHAALQRVGGEPGAGGGGGKVKRQNSDLTASDQDSRQEVDGTVLTSPESSVVHRDRTLSSEDRTIHRKSATAEILET
uniref:Uncharacterized protein n=1 Tax=Anopheles dirus TaxID=7168 RepID=A0A182NP95_9DIPT